MTKYARVTNKMKHGPSCRYNLGSNVLRWAALAVFLACLLLFQFRMHSELHLSSTDIKSGWNEAPQQYDLPLNSTLKMRNVSHSDNPLDYNTIIIHYHKTGNAISRSLLDILVREGKAIGLAPMKLTAQRVGKRPVFDHLKFRPRIVDEDESQLLDSDRVYRPTYDLNNSHNDIEDDNNFCAKQVEGDGRKSRKRRTKRYHDPETKCSFFKLREGVVLVLTAPDLFCSIDVLEEVFRTSRQSPHQGIHHSLIQRSSTSFHGTKIIHMIRDPFEMALSNYFYHSQIPTPEGWVKKECSPCDTTYYDAYGYPTNESNIDLILPALTKILPSQIDSIVSLCNSLFQSGQDIGLLNASFYDHLIQLDHYDGLRLSTSRQIIGSSSDGDILRMANNVLKLDQLINYREDGQNDVQLLTMHMAHWTRDPYESIMTVLDFVFGDSLAQERKRHVASEYSELYEMKSSNSSQQHVTSSKDFVRERKEKLHSLLVKDEVLGPVLHAAKEVLRLHS